MPKIKNMGSTTMRFGEGIIVTGSAGTDDYALVVTGSSNISENLIIDGRIGIGTDNPAHKLEVGGSISVGEYIYHRSDTDTFIRFQEDTINISAGNRSFIKIEEDTQDQISIGLDSSYGSDVFLSVSGSINTGQDLSVFGGGVLVSGSLNVGGTITTTNDISFQDNGGTFPTNTAGFFWDLNNDEARIYAKQPASDQIDFVFKLSDNNNSVDRFVYWIDDYRGGSYDRYPLVMHGEGVFFQSPESSEGVPNIGNSKARFDSNGRLAFNCQNQTDPSLLLNHAHIYSKLDGGTAEMYVRDSDGNVTKISPHTSEGEWEYFSRNTRTGKVVRVNMEKMIRKLEEITGESFMEEWYEDPTDQ